MTDQLAIDVSIARPSPAAIKAAGYSAVIGYVSGGELLNGRPKDMPAGYAAALLDAELGVGRIWERDATRALGGAAAGRQDAAVCGNQLRGLGYPAGCPLWFNVGDFAATPGQIPLIADYYQAMHAALNQWQCGGYGTAYIIGQLVARGAAGLWWQNAMNDDGTPGSTVSPHASVYQRVTHTRPTIAGCAPGDYDEDVYAMPQSAAIIWQRKVPAPPPPPKPTLVSVTRAGAILSDGERLAWH